MQYFALVATLLASSAFAAEQHGAACPTENQWNCLTRSFQRCANGRWSAEISTAKGQICMPAGMTMDMRLEHDGSVNNMGNSKTGQAPQNSNNNNKGGKIDMPPGFDTGFTGSAGAMKASGAAAALAAAVAAAALF